MNSQKADNQLNLALDATEGERLKSLELDVGYNPMEQEWELIVKYSGSLEPVRSIAISVTEMANEYAVIVIRESLISQLAELPEIDFIEKPKRLFFQVTNGKRVSCINPVQQAPYSLRGKGTLIGIIDSGIDFALEDFRNPDGTTRIRALWDQTISGNPPEGYSIGTEYTREQINEALQATNMQDRYQIVPSRDTSGHGTAVAGIAAGSGRRRTATEAVGENAGVAPESELLVVKMGNPRAEGFPRTTELMQGVDYVIKKAQEYRMPVAVNVSFGNSYGSHEPYN